MNVFIIGWIIELKKLSVYDLMVELMVDRDDNGVNLFGNQSTPPLIK